LLLAHVIRRGVQHQQHLGAGFPRRARRLRLPGIGADVDPELDLGVVWTDGERPERAPGVLADVQPEADLADLEDAGAIAGLEITLLVEHGVVRQSLLVIGRRDPSVTHNGSRVVPIALVEMRMPDHERDPGNLPRHALQGGRALAIEAVSQEQVLGRVAAQRELRGYQQVGARGARFCAVFEDLGGVAGEITDDAIDLRDRDLYFAAHRASLPSGRELPAPRGRPIIVRRFGGSPRSFEGRHALAEGYRYAPRSRSGSVERARGWQSVPAPRVAARASRHRLRVRAHRVVAALHHP